MSTAESDPPPFGASGLHFDDEKTRHLIEQFRTLAKDIIDEYAAKGSEFALDVRDSDRGVERWLVARKFNVENAIKMFKDCLAWREEKKLDHILDTPFHNYTNIKSKYPHAHHKFDKFGRPVYIEQTGLLNVKDLLTVTTMEEMLQYHLYLTEYMRKYLYPQGCALHQRQVDQVCTIVDLKGLGMGHFTQTVLNFIKGMADIDQANYPEILGQLFIVNVPTIFWMGWKVITPFLDERTRSKIQIIRGNGFKELSEIIASEDLPTFIGGKCECDGGCLNGNPIAIEFGKLAEIGHIEYDQQRQIATSTSSSSSSTTTTKATSTSTSTSSSTTIPTLTIPSNDADDENEIGSVNFHDDD